MREIVFTDLDGTLLDPFTYSYKQAASAIALLQQRGIPLIFCSAKTRAEQELYRQELRISDPFIVENGGAIFIPKDYFPFPFDYHKAAGGYLVIELGIPYQEIRSILKRVEEQSRLGIRGFGDMSAEEVADVSGLDVASARRAKEREYDETLRLEGSKEDVQRILHLIEDKGLNWAHGGKYYDVMGGNDKGKATSILVELFTRKLGRLKTIAIGDSLNDLPMLSVVDVPVLVQKPGGCWENIDLPGLYRVEGVGPQGWKTAIGEVLAVSSRLVHYPMSEERKDSNNYPSNKYP